ncbi:MAG: glutamyl-tRNA synthetase [Lasallia pustulata]|uniref:glutamate--tRNA ligase n=1 Tax=Lasallia pustulata TaxID=136370 RepID=A0A5M8PC47_9LECA|nr:MAG: glutamyl-tRNA synthetase [Lasallia pustulata]
MASLILASKANQAILLPALLAATYANDSDPNVSINIQFEDAESLKQAEGATAELTLGSDAPTRGSENAVARLVEAYPSLQGKHTKLVNEWLARTSAYYAMDFKTIESPLLELDSHLTLRTYIVGYSLSVADLSVWGAIRGNKVAYAAVKKGNMLNLSRWFRFVEETNTSIASAIHFMNAQALEKKTAKSKEGASYDIALPDTEKGVVTRFPPEPSGYLHIGHAKAALLNDYFAHEQYKGTMICRFDDTNPSKEKEEFQDAIVEDLALMGIKPDKTSYTSDYFEELYHYCVKLLKARKAYADDTDQDTMRQERGDGIASRRRDATVEDNLSHFEEMKKGTKEGLRWCMRAKMSVDNPNKAMRDPVIYRCNPQSHHRTGTTWKIYPTYDFCCPIVDSLEGVTHALRTIEYRDRNPQYDWMLDALNLRKVHIWDFARMNFIRTLLSKRKLAKFVDQGVVWGWDDPRFPTIRGIRRRGMTIKALREFILKQGPSRNIVNLDWTLFWATNKKYIDPVAPRHTAIIKENAVPATVKGARAAPYTEQKPKHGKNPGVGMKSVVFSGSTLIDQEDARSFKQDEEITLMGWGNAIVRKISGTLNPLNKDVGSLELELHLQGDVKKTEKKITWLSTEGQELVPVELVDFDYLITKDKIEDDDEVEDFLNPHTEFRVAAVADCNVAELKENDIIQFERKGYYRVDKALAHGQPAVLFNIPTGKASK